MEQLPADKIEKFQGDSSSSSETESIVPIILEKLKVGSSPDDGEQDSGLESGLPAIMENESEFDGSDLIAIPVDGRDLPIEAMLRAKKYSKITDDQRREFIDAVEVNGEKIINAAKRFNINYSSAKSILNVYKNEGRSIKKLTRNRGSKAQDEEGPNTQVIAEAKNPQAFSQNNGENPKNPAVTFDASTQTQTQEESQGDNYLLALRDRLIASKTEKRENPYSGSMSHDFSRHTGSLGDYSQQQMANSGYENSYNMQFEASRGSPSENKGNQPSPPSQYMQQSSSYLNQTNNPQQQYSLSNNSQPQSYQQQQQQSFNSENKGVYNSNQQSSNQQQQQNYPSQQDHRSQAQQYLIAQNNLDQQRLQSAAGYQNQLSNLGFAQPGSNNDYSGMSYTGTGQSQFFSDSANDSRNAMQSNQVQYLQPIMYLMPSNFPGLNGQGGFMPSNLQGLQSLQGFQGLQSLQSLQGLQGLGNLVSLPNSYMLYGGNNQGQNQGGQGQNQGQGQGQGQNQGQNQSQPQYQNQGQGQGQGQSQNQYQNQGQYYGPR